MSPLIDVEALARTYNHPSKDPWEAVGLYREAMKKPDDWGAQRVASAINSDRANEFEGISRSEVRAWVDDDSKPDAAHAVDVARELGWAGKGWTETVCAIAKLVIGIYAFGSIIEENYAPSWSPDNDQSQAAIETALTWAGVGYQHVERDGPKRGDEIRPGQHGTKLGRALVVAGAPVGDKNADSVRGLPEWVHKAPRVVQMELVLLFVRGRATELPEKVTRQVQADRGRRYYEDWARLVENVTGESAITSDLTLTIPASAVRELGLV